MNPTFIQFFHWYTPGDSFLWPHASEQARHLASLGVTGVWLPPFCKGSSGANSVGYDPYDLFDVGEFEQRGTTATKYGTREQLLAACQALRENGIAIIADAILNHRGPGDELESFPAIAVDPEDRNRELGPPRNIRSYTKFTFPGRGTTYSDLIWDYHSFTGVDFAYGESEEAIYRILNGHADRWDEVVGTEKGNYDFLLLYDVETRSPAVQAELRHWGKWLHDLTGFTGVRLDAVKHLSPTFLKQWLKDLRHDTEADLFAIGEYWAPEDPDSLSRFLDATEGCMSLFDCVLQANFHRASEDGSDFDLREIFTDTLAKNHPDHAVTFVANHDTQPLQTLESPVAAWFKPLAYALILLRKEGIPCVFYPDLYGAHYYDQDSSGERKEVTLPIIPELQTLLQLRQSHAHGEQRDYFENRNCIALTRCGDESHPGCTVILNNGRSSSFCGVELGVQHGHRSFLDALGNTTGIVTSDDHGRARFPCAPESVSVYIATES